MGTVRVLVNNAGVTGPLGPLVELADQDLARVLDVNLAAPVRLIREVLRQPREGSLAIVNITSLAARTGSPGEYVVYAATKAALETLTVGLATEAAAQGVRVNAVALRRSGSGGASASDPWSPRPVNLWSS
jgi:NAD(P)-dependent dehydrogenase (short-subunit alcohol dehydrogenase family)